MTKRGQKFGKVLFVSMLLTLTIALGGCAGDKEEEGSSQVATTPAAEAGSETAAAETTDGEASQITIGIPQDLNSLDPNKAVGSEHWRYYLISMRAYISRTAMAI